MFKQMVESLLGFDLMDLVVNQADARPEPDGIFRKILNQVDIKTRISAEELSRIPRSGPLIVVANHPTGFAEGLAVPAVIDSVRSDLTVMGQSIFGRWPALQNRMLLVNSQPTPQEHRDNAAGLKAAANLLREARSLMLFPAAEVARPRSRFLQAEELPWHSGLVNLVRLTGTVVVPVHVSGRTGIRFRLLSRIHPRLGLLRLCREFLDQSGGEIRLTVGHPIYPDSMPGSRDTSDISAWFRERVLKLDCRSQDCRFR